MRRLVPIILAVLAICLCAAANKAIAEEKTVSVVADGYSYLGDNDTIKTARERALAEAERNAVEQGSYSYLESQTTVENFQVTIDEIRSHVKGVITRKKILLDQMDKETLRYHIRLEAEVKFADFKTVLEQHEKYTPPAEDLPVEIQAKTAPDTMPYRKPPKKDQTIALRRLQRLRNENPQRYIEFMTRVQPQLNNVDVFIKRLQRLQARDPGAGQDIRNILHKTPIKGRGEFKLMERIRFVQMKRPQDYILMMELLYPEVRPRAMELHWLKRKHGKKRPEKVSSAPAPVHR